MTRSIHKSMETADWRKHIFFANWQHEQFSELSKKKLTVKHLNNKSWLLTSQKIIHAFLRMKYKVSIWAKDSVTIHPCLCTYIYNCQEHGKVKEGEIVDITSNDVIHDSHAIHTFTPKVMDHFQNERQLDLEYVVVISDGCARQYKSKIPFMN